MATRICILTETYHPVVGGGEAQARFLARGLTKRGMIVSVLTRRSHRSLPKGVDHDQGLEIRRLPPTGPGHLKKWGLLVTSFFALLRSRHRCDLIYVSGFRVLGVVAVAIAKLCDKSCVLKADSLGEMSGEFFRGGLAKLGMTTSSWAFRASLSLRNRVLRSANVFIAISSAVRDELLEEGIDERRVELIPNSVDVGRFCPVGEAERLALRARLDLPQSAAIVTFTGRLVAYKGLQLLLEVWRRLVGEHGNALLLLVGSGGLDIHNCEDGLRSYVEEHGLTSSVRFAGEVDAVELYLQASDGFVFPVEREAFGVSLVEAMACGLPVVSTAVGGLKDIVEDGRNALVVSAGDADELYEALDSLLRRRAPGNLGREARRTVESRYASTIALERYVDLFDRLAPRVQ